MYKYSSSDGVSSQMAGLSVNKDPPQSSQQSTVDSSITTPKHQPSRLSHDEYIPNQFGGGSHHYSRMLSTNTVTTSFRSSPSASANNYLPNQFGSNHDSVSRSSPTTTVTFSNSRCFGSSGGGNGSSTSSATSSTMTTSRMSTTSSMGSQGANRFQAGDKP